MGYFEKKLSGNVVYNGIIVSVRMDKAEVASGHIVNREVVDHPGGVAVLPVDGEGNAYLVRQFRYPFMKEMLEVPAGKLEPGEDPLECAIRELKEETGFTAGEIIDMHVIYASPGISSEVLHAYLAIDLSSGQMELEEDEFLSVEKWPLDELLEMCLNGEIHDGKTIITIMKATEILKRRGGYFGKQDSDR
ncbi:MAG: NUDIX hydrolase [Clostridiales bacterium]|nr:NUDIX hydrolase [Clostridiales bacterium]